MSKRFTNATPQPDVGARTKMDIDIPQSDSADAHGLPKAEEGSYAGWARFAMSPILAALVYLAYWQIAPRLPFSSIGAVACSTVVAMALGVWVPAQLGHRLRVSRGGALANLALSGAVALPVVLAVVARHRIPIPWVYLLHIPGLAFLAVIWMASSLGVLLSFLVRGANMIPPIAAVLALVDIWTVLLGGPVQKLMQSEDPRAHAVSTALTVPLATPPPPRGATPMQGSVGFADFLFVAFFIASISRFAADRRTYTKTLAGLIVVLSTYMLVVLFKEINLPALVPMAVTMIALHWRLFHYERSELFAMLYAALFIVLIAAGFWFLTRQREEAPPGAFAALSPAATAQFS